MSEENNGIDYRMMHLELGTEKARQRIAELADKWGVAAKLNILANRGVSPETERGLVERSEKSGIPVGVLRNLDNRDMDPMPDLSQLSEDSRRYLAEHPSLAVFFRKDPLQLERIISTANFGMLPIELRKQRVEHNIDRWGYTAKQLLQLKKEGYERDADGRFYRTEAAGEKYEPSAVEFRHGIPNPAEEQKRVRKVYYDRPILESWYAGEHEKASRQLTRLLKTGDPQLTKEDETLYGVTGKDLTRILTSDVQLLKGLHSVYGANWREYDDETLRRALDKVGKMMNLPTEGIPLERLRPRTTEEYTDPAELLDVFGLGSKWRDFRRGRPSNEKVETIINNIDSESPENIEWANLELMRQHRELRGATTGTQMVEGIMNTGRFMLEMLVTGGKPTNAGTLTRASSKFGVLAASKLMGKRILGTELKRLAAYIPGITLEETTHNASSIDVQFDEHGEMVATLKKKEGKEITAAVINRVIDTYIENVSERAGVFVDALSLKKAVNLVPQKIREAYVSKAIGTALKDLGSSKWVKAYDHFVKGVGVNSALGEYIEEKFGDLLRTASTALSDKFGTYFGDLGQRQVFGSLADEIQTFGQVALTSTILNTPQIVHRQYMKAKLANFVDSQSGLKRAVVASEELAKSPAQVKRMYFQLSHDFGIPTVANIAPDKLREIAEQFPEENVLDGIGVDEKMLDNAELWERAVPVSLADAMGNLSPEAHTALLNHITPTTLGSNVTAFQIDEALKEKPMEARAEEQTDFEDAYDKALSQLAELNLSDRVIKSAAKIFGGFSHYFARESDMTAADWIRNVGFKMMKAEDWQEQFKQELYQTEQKKAADELLQFRDLPRGRAADYESGAAVHKLLEDNVSQFPDKIKKGFVKFFEALISLKPPKGMDPLTADNFVTSATAAGLLRKEGKSAYLTIGNNTLRVSHHNASAKTFEKHGEVGNNILSIVFEKKDEKPFRGKDSVNAVEYVYKTDELDGVKPALIWYDISAFLKTGEYTDHVGANFVHYSGSPEFKEAAKKKVEADKQAMYQTAGVKKGVTAFNPEIDTADFNETWEATIALFEGAADASTLVHEITHYAHRMMELLVKSGMASDRMKEDLAKLKAWAQLTPEAAQKGYDAYVAQLKEKSPESVPETFENWSSAQYYERIAEAFETFIMEGGKAPSVELIGAFSFLKQALLSIYKSAEALGVNMSDEVRFVFRGMLASEATLREEDALRDIVKTIDTGMLGLNQDDIKYLRKLLAMRNDQALAQLEADKAAQLKEALKAWRKQAQAEMDATPVYRAWQDIRKTGLLDFASVVELVGEDIAFKLRDRGLTTASGRKIETADAGTPTHLLYRNATEGVHPASYALQHKFDSVEDMLNELANELTPQEFMDNFLKDSEQAFHENFPMTEAALSVWGTIELLETLSDNLHALRGRAGKALRTEELRFRAEEEISNAPVSWIMSDKSLSKSCEIQVAALNKAMASNDLDAAIRALNAIRHTIALTSAKAQAKRTVEKFRKVLKKGVHAKKGSIDGKYQDALRDLAINLGLMRQGKNKPAHNVSGVISAYNSDHKGAEFTAPPVALGGNYEFNSLAFGDVEELLTTVEFLYGEGREIVSEAHRLRKERIANNATAWSQGLNKLPLSDNSVANTSATWGSKLRNLIGWAARWDKESAIWRGLYEPITKAQSYAMQTSAPLVKIVVDAQTALAKSASSWNLKMIGDIKFPAELVKRKPEYAKWSEKMVLKVVLNMGCAKNRQRLIAGFEWGEQGEAYLQRIASLLSAADWQNVQKIWDATNSDTLTKPLQEVFHRQYHYDMKMEKPLPLQVTSSDGATVDLRGGYVPLRYAYHKNAEVQSMAEKGSLAPEYARPGFSKERVEILGDPVDLLDTSFIGRHIKEVAYYVEHAELMRELLPSVHNHAFSTEFISTQGEARYRNLLDILENIAQPGAWMKGQVGKLEKVLRSMSNALALWGNIRNAGKQLASGLVGHDEIKGYHWPALKETLAHPMRTYHYVCGKSGFMANRIEQYNLDFALASSKEFDVRIKRHWRNAVDAGRWLANSADALVAFSSWMASYNKSMAKGLSEKDAVAEADEFVAKTQGGNRPVDMSPAQLNFRGRMTLMFVSAPSAQATSATRTIGEIMYGEKKGGAALSALFSTVLSPVLFAALAGWLNSGDDDEDEFFPSYFKHVSREFFGMFPYGDAASDFAIAVAGGKPSQFDAIEAPSLKALVEVLDHAKGTPQDVRKGEWGKVAYRVADAVSIWFEVPVLRAYDRVIKNLEDWSETNIDGILDPKEEAGLKKPFKKNRRRRR